MPDARPWVYYKLTLHLRLAKKHKNEKKYVKLATDTENFREFSGKRVFILKRKHILKVEIDLETVPKGVSPLLCACNIQLTHFSMNCLDVTHQIVCFPSSGHIKVNESICCCIPLCTHCLGGDHSLVPGCLYVWEDGLALTFFTPLRCDLDL